jgi:hypothetical protein
LEHLAAPDNNAMKREHFVAQSLADAMLAGSCGVDPA